MDDEWDLHAVVKSCAASTTAAATSDNTPVVAPRNESKMFLFPNAGEPSTPATTTTISFDGGRSCREQQESFGDTISFAINPLDSQASHAKTRKIKQKRLVELREEELSNDGWGWRKYGQKSIKGSPYPRNYYRCSTTKDCLARKQIDRNSTDISKFIVSYSGDHLHTRPTHFSSIVGTTRSTKFSTVATNLPELAQLSSSSPPSTSSISPTTSLKEDETEMNDEDLNELIKNY